VREHAAQQRAGARLHAVSGGVRAHGGQRGVDKALRGGAQRRALAVQVLAHARQRLAHVLLQRAVERVRAQRVQAERERAGGGGAALVASAARAQHEQRVKRARLQRHVLRPRAQRGQHRLHCAQRARLLRGGRVRAKSLLERARREGERLRRRIDAQLRHKRGRRRPQHAQQRRGQP
jgi:hypothetical protein